MNLDSLSWGSPDWLLPTAALLCVALTFVIYSYGRTSSPPGVRIFAALLKALGLVALALCLVEPLYHGRRARPGANLFVVLADGSESLRIRDRGESESRGEQMRRQLTGETPWRTRLGQDFDARQYVFDRRLEAVDDFEGLSFDGESSRLATSLETIARRYRDRPVAGVLVLTDGNATDLLGHQLDFSTLPPIYPVVLGGEAPVRDLAIRHLTVSQTGFESSPVTVQAEISQSGYSDEEIVVQILEDKAEEDATEDDVVIEQIVHTLGGSGNFVARFELNPEIAGVHFYRVRVRARSEIGKLAPPGTSEEATLENNSRLAVVDRSGGPYRVLYVSGRPNWEFKFLRRALADDTEIQLVGLIRIAEREPKFDYRSRYGESTNPLFRGFGNDEDEEAERYDQPVLMRIGTLDDEELRDGFPKAADQLFRYDAVILDDLEAEFFTQDQMVLLQAFVSKRGGGFLMLGGQESFATGGYDRTPVGEMLPVYLDSVPAPPAGAGYRLSLTREGWIQPWIRLRKTEEGERVRLDAMPSFLTLNPARGIKPGATVLARVGIEGAEGTRPAFVVQRFGKGRAAALLLGDTWRWSLRRESVEENDHAKAWRQTVRWLVADVPARVETDAVPQPDAPGAPLRLSVRVRDEEYEPLENASVRIDVSGPDGEPIEVTAEASAAEAGLYEADHLPRQAGRHRARIKARSPDGSELEEGEAGWATDFAAEEYRSLSPDREWLTRLAEESGGEVVELSDLESFITDLPSREVPITDPWVYPLWHQWAVFLFAALCLSGEWALRRWKGLP